MPALNTTFKQVFGEGLAHHGFVKIKGRQPYFVRLVGDEILRVVALKPGPGWKGFCVLGGIATIYRRRIDFEISPKNSTNWLKPIDYLYGQANLHTWGKDFWKSLNTFPYNEDTMVDAVKYSLKMTVEIILPIFNNVIDLNSCIDYCHKFRQPMGFHFRDGTFNNYMLDTCVEGLFWHKINNLDAHLGKITEIAQKKGALKTNSLEDVLNDHEWRTEVLAELERRKGVNTEILRSFGIKI
jgi:hypothetical protein